MSGIYVHIPFCKKACHYCNFHFSTSLAHKDKLLSMLHREIGMTSDYLSDRKLTSIYLGGGTPSLLEAYEIKGILDSLSDIYKWSDDIEITLEANPDDISARYLAELHHIGINRLSVGIQSFAEEDLRYMNRAHDAHQAESCLDLISKSPIDNYSLDLIYGSPTTTMEIWQDNVRKAMSYDPSHISAYCLTIEPDTAMGRWLDKGKIDQIDDHKANDQFAYLIDSLRKDGYQHYEISNFARPGHYAIHNTNYWRGEHYLGIGPAAHSYDGLSRSWNVANNAQYIRSISDDVLPRTTETLSVDDVYNEMVMTGLRTMWGVAFADLKSKLTTEYVSYLKDCISDPWISQYVFDNGTCVKLTDEGKVFADKIASLCFK